MTTVTTAQANKLYQVALFTAANRNRSMVNILTEQQDAPKAVSPDKKSTKQTSAGAPVVRITDLNKQAGDEVTFSIMHKLSKRPTMGDERVEGRGEDLSHADFSLKINQGRHLVDAGGRMSQQRTKFNLASSARTLLGTYFNDLQDQCAIVHLAGARGDFVADDTILPTADHPEFKKIMINDVLPPTHDRHFFGGDATSFESIDQSDLFTLALVDNLSLFIDEMAHPLQPVRLSGDELYGEDGRELFAGHDVEIRPGRVMHFACSPGEVSVLYAVAPKAGSRQVQDELRAWSEEVAAGALERLFMQTGVSWSDPSRAQYFSVLFSEGIRRAYRDTLATSPYSSYRNPVRRQRFY